MCSVLNIVRQILSNLKRAFKVLSKKTRTMSNLYVLCDYYVTLIGMSLNKNCFLFIQVMRGNVEKMDTKTSPVSPKCQRGSSFVVGNKLICLCQCQLTRCMPHLCFLLAPQHGSRCSVSWFTSRGVGESPSPKLAARRLFQAMHHSSPFSARTCQQWQVPLGHGSFRRGAQISREQPTGCMAWQPMG